MESDDQTEKTVDAYDKSDGSPRSQIPLNKKSKIWQVGTDAYIFDKNS